VPAKTQSERAIALCGEKVQKVFIPAPGRMLAPVDEKQRYRARFAGRSLVDHLKHERLVRTIWSGFPAAD
jgi:hypothetical protein